MNVNLKLFITDMKNTISRHKMASLLVGLGLLSVNAASFAVGDVVGKKQAVANKISVTDVVKNAKYVEYNSGYANLVEKLLPAVVNISATGTTEVQVSPLDKMMNFPGIFPFAMFEEPNGAPIKRKIETLGSGFIISSDGYIVTNHHVVKDTDEILITMNDKREYKAKLIGSDAKTDLAVLKITPDEPLEYVKFGSSETSRIGDQIITIGNPFNFGGTVTSGIISAKARTALNGSRGDFIQTDAAINSGNSGGPMFNLHGEVIGINTAIFSGRGGGNIGIGFAIPSDSAVPVIEKLKDNKKIKHPWVGIMYTPVDKKIAEAVGLADIKGGFIREFSGKNTPAEKSGLKPGDVILEVDGKAITKDTYLPALLEKKNAGDKISAIIFRYGKTIKLDVTLGEMPEDVDSVAKAQEQKDVQKKDNTDISVIELAPDMRNGMRVPDDVKGVFVTNVRNLVIRHGNAVRRNDIIQQINDLVTTDVASFNKAFDTIKKSGKKHAIFKIYRGSQTVTELVEITEEK
jgi:serine protease Do